MSRAFIADSQTSTAGAADGPQRFWPLMAWLTGSLVVVTLIKLAAFDYVGEATPFLLYFASILGAGWYGGWAGGLIATGLSGMLGTYFFLPPFHVLRLANAVVAARLGVFLIEGTLMTAIVTRLRQERERARRSAMDAEGATAKLAGVLRGVGDGITVQDLKGQLIYANSAAARLIGFSSAEALLAASVPEVMGRFELLTPTGDPFPVAELPGRMVVAGLPAPERLMRFRVRASGEERWALVRANAITLPGSDVPYAVNVFQDVTETRHRDEELRISRERFLTTLSSIGDAVIATDATGAVTFMNPIAEELTGWNVADARDRPLAQVFNIINEQTRQPVETPVARVLREGKVVGLANHTVLLSRKGLAHSIDDSAAPIRSPEGPTMGTVLVFRDVSSQRTDERRGAFIALAAAELASSLDYRQTLSTVARLAVPTIADWCAVDIYEHGSLQRLAVAHVDPEKIRLVYELERRYPPDPKSDGGAYEVVRSGKHVFAAHVPDEALAGAAQDGEHLRLLRQLALRSYIAVPLRANGVVTGVISLAMAESGRTYNEGDLRLALTLADRSALAVEHARLYAEATQARNEAERANRAKDEFLAMLGHELRNPLAPMLTALQLMKMRAPEVLERERSVLDRQVKHLVTLVDDLLDISRITRSGIHLAKEPVDLADMVARALELTSPLIEQRRHGVLVTVPRGLVVLGDPVRLAQVLTNLLTNAAKYTDPGGRIEVTGQRQGDEIVVRVKDNGAGIPAELLPRVFDLFVQGGQSIDRAMGGLGLGLTIVRTVVQLHGGRVSAASDGPGQGSELSVVLPALSLQIASVDVAPPPRAPSSPVVAHPVVDVLIVDDNADALDLLAEGLALAGYRTHTAPDAAAALLLAATVKPAVALLDIGLPVMDGYELARRLRATADLSRIKLVAITGYGQATDKERARMAGFDEHLIKPISLETVERVVARLLSTQASEVDA